MVRIAIADNQLLFRQALSSLFGEYTDISLVMEAANGQAFLEKLKKSSPLPDIALIDTEMPGMTGRDLNQQLRVLFPTIKIIVLSMMDEPSLIASLIEGGANAFLGKSCTKEELNLAINTVYHTGLYINQHTLKALQFKSALAGKKKKSSNGLLAQITSREAEILQMICCELNTAEIAQKLYVSTRTVECHRNNLLAKTGCRNTAGLVLFAVKSGLYKLGNF